MKKIFSVLLSLILILTCVPMVKAVEDKIPFDENFLAISNYIKSNRITD